MSPNLEENRAECVDLEAVLRKYVRALPFEFQQDLSQALFNAKDRRLVGQVWSVRYNTDSGNIVLI